jgi:hypothetical protein
VVRLASLTRPTPDPPPPAVPLFVPVALDAAQAVNAAGTVELTHDDDGAHVRVVGRRGKSQQGGVAFDIAGDVALRFELRMDSPQDVQRLVVGFYDGGGRQLARWTWDPSRARMGAGKARTYVLKPGEPFGPFKPEGDAVEGRATTAAVLAEISGKNAAKFTLSRATAVEPKHR